MTTKNGDMPAMPVFPDTETGHASAFRGLTKREKFAMAAMQGLLSSFGRHDVTDYGEIASDAVMAADALLAALAKADGGE